MKREFTLDIDGQEITVAAERDGDAIKVSRDDTTYTVRILSESVVGVQSGSRQPTGNAGLRTAAPTPPPARGGGTPPAPQPSSAQPAGGPGAITSPMTGVIDQVLVQEGASVAEGDTIIVLEAMKMYIDVMASAAGTVSGIAVKPGDSVKEGQQLLSISAGGAG